MSKHTLATSKAATLIKLAFAAGAKLSAAFIAFGLTALVTRNMPNDEAGLFLLGFSLLTVLSVIFRLGLDNVVLRFLSAHGTDAFAQEKFNRGLLWIATLSVPATIVGMLTSDLIATHIFNKPAFGPVLFWMLPALPAMAIFFLIAQAFQSQHRVVVTTIFQNLGISTVFILGFGYLLCEQPQALNSITVAQIYGGAALIIFVSSVIAWFGQHDISFRVLGYKDHELIVASANLWGASVMALVTVWAGVLIAGSMVPVEELARLSAAQRTANLTSFILIIVNMVAAPRYARMWSEGDIQGIERLAKWSTRGMICMVTPVILFMLFLPEKIMAVFGKGFEQAGILLAIMAIGQFINVATGSVGYLLNMSGHERDFRRVTQFSGPLTIICALIFIYLWGVTGAAIATAVGVGVQNLMAMAMVKRKLGFWPIC
ncbi:lipopolysaccharide biosynthesis protein [Thalassolituus oleivorans]|uniref:lipopolysaccharide biosynthesis protein n=1 Tax=Thalassolituus oleivorans TaxID=187493 RepID=UPI001670C08B|nr:polysaccharide biosynthesis C-terminal domain-containing protein [Thalassolituus oleivorans]